MYLTFRKAPSDVPVLLVPEQELRQIIQRVNFLRILYTPTIKSRSISLTRVSHRRSYIYILQLKLPSPSSSQNKRMSEKKIESGRCNTFPSSCNNDVRSCLWDSTINSASYFLFSCLFSQSLKVPKKKVVSGSKMEKDNQRKNERMECN